MEDLNQGPPDFKSSALNHSATPPPKKIKCLEKSGTFHAYYPPAITLLPCIYSYVPVCYWYVTRMLFVGTRILVVCTRMYSYVLVGTRRYSFVLVCTRMYSYVLVCTRIYTHVLLCSWYVTRMLFSRSYSYISRMYSYVLVCIRIYSYATCTHSCSVFILTTSSPCVYVTFSLLLYFASTWLSVNKLYMCYFDRSFQTD